MMGDSLMAGENDDFVDELSDEDLFKDDDDKLRDEKPLRVDTLDPSATSGSGLSEELLTPTMGVEKSEEELYDDFEFEDAKLNEIGKVSDNKLL
jgi:hypothetical protein